MPAQPFCKKSWAALAALLFTLLLSHSARADSMTLAETWKDNSAGGVYSGSTDTGTFKASLTVSNLSGLTAAGWSNLLVTVNSDFLSLAEDAGGNLTTSFSDVLADAPNYGGTVTATGATFYFQLLDENGDEVNAYQMIFSRSGSTFTVTGQTVNPAAVQPPWSIAAANYLDYSGSGSTFAITDQTSCEVILQDATSLAAYADVARTLNLVGTNTISYDTSGDELNHVQVSGTADLTAPVLTILSPAAAVVNTNGQVTVEAKATDGAGVQNVEFYVNGLDYGGGVSGASNLWSIMLALQPGTNLIQAQAVDINGNESPLSSVTVTYLDKQTNAPAITLSEHWLDSDQTDEWGDEFYLSQDVGVLNAALPVPGLQGLPAGTWSNLVLVLSFGDIYLSNSLANANVLTPSNAVFYLDTIDDPNTNLLTEVRLSVARSGNNLLLAYATGNPTYDWNYPIIADDYLGTDGSYQDAQPFSLTLLDGDTFNAYANVAQTVFISETDHVTYDAQTNELDDLKVSGAADYQPPTCQITAPAAGLLVSNALCNVAGKAADNQAVADVFVSANNAGWVEASSTNNWTNWVGQVVLTPGTNAIQAYAVDSSGNVSATNTVRIVYVLSAPLAVGTNGVGALSVNDNGALLQIGKAYFITAKPVAGSGFRFTNWLGGTSLPLALLTNGPTVQFVMVSNLMLQANFADTNRPVVLVTNVASGMQVSNANYVVAGVATDNVAVAGVYCQLNGGGWTNPATFNGRNWAQPETLTPGTNLFAIYAVDSSGNVSATNTVRIVYVLSAPLAVSTNGIGALSVNDNGALLQIGKAYFITAKPVAGSGFRFTNWLGGTSLPLTLLTNGPTVQFVMGSNLMLQANFVYTNRPTLAITNPTATIRTSNQVYTISGHASDKAGVAGVYSSQNGAPYVSASTINHWSNWWVTVTLPLGTNSVRVYAVNASNNLSPVVTATVIRTAATTPFPVDTTEAIRHPQASQAFDGTNYLVVYQVYPAGSGHSSAVGRFVSQSGELVGPEISLNPGGADDPPWVAFDGLNYLAAWADYSDTSNGVPVKGTFVSPNGTVAGAGLISQSTTVDDFDTLVYGGGVYFLMWSDYRTTPDSVYGALVDTGGNVVASDFLISSNASLDESSQGSAAFDGTNFLAVWSAGSGRLALCGQFIDLAGNRVGDPITIYTNTAAAAARALASVTFDGTKYLVLFTLGLNTNNAAAFHVAGRFVTTGGEVLTNQINLTTDPGPQIAPAADFDGENYLITWNQGFNPFSHTATAGTINGRFFDAGGFPVTPEFPVFTPAAGQTATWAPVLFDGYQFMTVTGLGKVTAPAPGLEFTNGIIRGAFLTP